MSNFTVWTVSSAVLSPIRQYLKEELSKPSWFSSVTSYPLAGARGTAVAPSH